ncbi:MAG: radical SAM family heme chaperone HemW [Oscillospiraceae bacterium]|jgi:oxygen-independent coproporphyrinogen-3 oxidase|nr:radical SAM family heme chaperone HemW [Oscillospiraceae bacterium]
MGLIGLYIHVPFCARKCPYCDFYSLPADDDLKDAYFNRVVNLLNSERQVADQVAFDTVYLGGGTPSQLGTERLVRLLKVVQQTCAVQPEAEITLECNPSDVPALDCAALHRTGYNRVSLGLQSAADAERVTLGRRGSAQDVTNALHSLRRARLDNISLDMMLGVPGQTPDSLRKTLAFAVQADVQHISAYLLKIEPGTPFATRKFNEIADDDAQADMYHLACEYLEKHGFLQYEISNFALPGYESRHNLKYWHCEEYWGLGPGAHSFLGGRRFYISRNLDEFISSSKLIDDGPGGSLEEYAMLALRLNEGLREDKVRSRFAHSIPQKMRRAAENLERHGLVITDDDGIRLTQQGFLLSNGIIGQIVTTLDNLSG